MTAEQWAEMVEKCQALDLRLVQHQGRPLLLFPHRCQPGLKPGAVRFTAWWADRVHQLLEDVKQGQTATRADNLRGRKRRIHQAKARF